MPWAMCTTRSLCQKLTAFKGHNQKLDSRGPSAASAEHTRPCTVLIVISLGRDNVLGEVALQLAPSYQLMS